jgi:hypothetical protein
MHRLLLSSLDPLPLDPGSQIILRTPLPQPGIPSMLMSLHIRLSLHMRLSMSLLSVQLLSVMRILMLLLLVSQGSLMSLSRVSLLSLTLAVSSRSRRRLGRLTELTCCGSCCVPRVGPLLVRPASSRDGRWLSVRSVAIVPRMRGSRSLLLSVIILLLLLLLRSRIRLLRAIPPKSSPVCRRAPPRPSRSSRRRLMRRGGSGQSRRPILIPSRQGLIRPASRGGTVHSLPSRSARDAALSVLLPTSLRRV